ESAFAQLAQDHFGLLLDKQQFEARKALADLRNDVRQQIGAESRKNAESQRARFRIQRAPCDQTDLLDLVEHVARARDDLAADLGQQHLARRALDQGDAEFIFELHDLGRQRWLADKSRLGSAT